MEYETQYENGVNKTKLSDQVLEPGSPEVSRTMTLSEEMKRGKTLILSPVLPPIRDMLWEGARKL